ncbi:hypothetical protein EG329_011862 [Mollisiaceae sp. DMI_Dod_QoI]|nr:hypothetical protein EG329_011862 [Helotiales sp. DMI_Dod_QoI]
MASFTKEKDDDTVYETEFDEYYTCDDELAQLTRDVKNLNLSSQASKDIEPPASGRRAEVVVTTVDEELPIAYQLMVLINNVKFTGNILITGFGHHDFAARGSRQIARGGYFQTREIAGLGVAKYPLLPTASAELSARSYRALANELRVLSHPPLMMHDNIVKIKTIGWTRLDSIEATWMPMIFLELAELGTLTQYLSEHQLGVDSKLEVSQDVGHGLQALHACGIMHGDLKFDNVLMFKCKDGKVRAKLSDFGCSFFVNGDEDKDATTEISAGTKPWTSPELGQQVQIYWLPSADTYTFGLLVWRVFLNGRSPFDGLEEEDIDQRKTRDLMLSDASISLEDEYDKNMLLRGAVSSVDRSHLYMRGVAMPKRCFRHTLTLRIDNRSLDKAMDSLSSNKVYGTHGSTKPTLDERRPTKSSVAEDDAISSETQANAYLQLCYANIDSFGTTRDFGEAIKCLKLAANLGSTIAASILRPLILATGKTLDHSLEKELKRWLVKAVEAGSLLARDGLRILDEEPSILKKAEEPLKLFMGAKSARPEGVATADLVETFFLPVNLGVMKTILGTNTNPVFAGMNVEGTFMSRSRNTHLHAGAALGVDPDHFRNVISVADLMSINAQDDIGNTALHLAMRFGNIEVAKILLEHGARASLPNKNGETPWHWLASLNEADIDELALLMSEDKDGLEIFSRARNSDNDQYVIAHGGTPLHWAVQMRSLSASLTLLSYGADPLIKCRGLSPVDLAIKDNAAELLEVFINFIMKAGLDFSPQCTLIDLATEGNPDGPIDVRLEPVDTLLLQVAFIRPLHECLIHGGVDWLQNMRATLRILHENGYLELWSKGNNQARLEALRMSSFSDSSWSELIEAIIVTAEIFPGCAVENDQRVDNEAVAMFWNEALKGMLKSGQPVAIHFAIDKIRKYSSSSRLDDAEALLRGYCSSLSADISVVESILKDCADIDCTDNEGRTPLMKAVRERNFEIATYLLDRGADVNRTWTHEGEPVHILYEYVANNTDVDVVPLKYLLEPMHPFLNKIPPFFNSSTQEDTILHQACKDGNPVIVDYLLSKLGTKDHLDRRGVGGFTALHHAVFNGHASLVMKLCRAGADVNARSGTSDMPNRERSTPLDLCFHWGTQSTEFLSRKFGLERTREDVLIGRLNIAEYLVRRHQARRASRSLVHRSLALKLSLIAAQDGMTRLLAVALRLAKKEIDTYTDRDVDYSLLLGSLLWLAAPRGHVNATRLLLNLGADVKQRSVKGRSLLHVVSWVGKAEMVYVLVKHGGADINVEDAEGETPGSYSVKSHNLATIRMVKSLGGLWALPRERMIEIMRNSGIDTSVIPPTFNLRYTARFGGEPSDDELSDERPVASESEGSSTNNDDENGTEVVKESVADDVASRDEGSLDE